MKSCTTQIASSLQFAPQRSAIPSATVPGAWRVVSAGWSQRSGPIDALHASHALHTSHLRPLPLRTHGAATLSSYQNPDTVSSSVAVSWLAPVLSRPSWHLRSKRAVHKRRAAAAAANPDVAARDDATSSFLAPSPGDEEELLVRMQHVDDDDLEDEHTAADLSLFLRRDHHQQQYHQQQQQRTNGGGDVEVHCGGSNDPQRPAADVSLLQRPPATAQHGGEAATATPAIIGTAVSNSGGGDEGSRGRMQGYKDYASRPRLSHHHHHHSQMHQQQHQQQEEEAEEKGAGGSSRGSASLGLASGPSPADAAWIGASASATAAVTGNSNSSSSGRSSSSSIMNNSRSSSSIPSGSRMLLLPQPQSRSLRSHQVGEAKDGGGGGMGLTHYSSTSPKRKTEPSSSPSFSSSSPPPPLFSDEDPWVAAAYGDLPVAVTGRAPPPPLLSYNDLVTHGPSSSPSPSSRNFRKMPKVLLRNAAAAFRLGRPTPIQSHVIPAMMEGRDVLAVSCPGSGKTLAYLLPLMASLMARNRVQGSKNCASPEALVLVPTRELAEQVFYDVQVLLRGTHLKALAVHGGVSVADQVLAIRGRYRRSAGGVDLLVATPGRLLQLVEQRRAVRLNRLGVLVVDEADRLMDLGMWPDLRRLLSQPGLPTARQTVLVAASQPREPTSLAEAASELLRDALTVAVGDGSGTSGVVRQLVELVLDGQKLGRLLELLAPGAGSGVVAASSSTSTTSSTTGRDPRGVATTTTSQPHSAAAAATAGPTPTTPINSSSTSSSRQPGSPKLDSGSSGRTIPAPSPGGPAVVFTRSLIRAEEVAKHLAARGVSVALLHRDLTQEQRDEAMHCFRFGVTSVLVATALASRGLNFPDVDLVVNYDVPASASVYLHQVGRTGRGGRPGSATTLVTPSNRPSAPWLLDCLRRSGSPAPAWLEKMAADARAKVAEIRSAAAAAATAEPDGSAAQPRRRRTAVMALDDPAAGAAVRFGSYMMPRVAVHVAVQQRGGGGNGEGSAAAAAPPDGSSLPPLQPVVVDRRHDAGYWQTVFESALQSSLQSAAATMAARSPDADDYSDHRHRYSSGQQAAASPRGGSDVRHAAPVDDAPVSHGSLDSGMRQVVSVPPDGDDWERRQLGRLVYRDAAAELEAHPGGGLSAGPQRGHPQGGKESV